MKATRKIFGMMLFVAIMAIIGSESAMAKYSKASSKFSYSGVSVEVVDRRDQIGRTHSNTYGYTKFNNNNPHTVNLNWKCYGVRKSDHKLVLVDSGNFSLNAGKERQEVYNYEHSSRNNDYHKDYEKYVVAIEVVGLEDAPVGGGSTKLSKDGVTVEVFDRRDKIGRSHTNTNGYMEFKNNNNEAVAVTWTIYGNIQNSGKRVRLASGTIGIAPKETHKEVYPYTDYNYTDMNDFKNYVCEMTVNKVKASGNYQELKRKIQSGKELSQADYALAIKLIDDVYVKVKPEVDRVLKNQDEAAADNLQSRFASELDMVDFLGTYLDKAESSGKLNSENLKNFRAVKNKFQNMF